MAIIVQKERITPRLVPMTPLEIYLQQVKGTYDAIRVERLEKEYYPPQLGGFFGQREVMDETLVLELTDFEID